METLCYRVFWRVNIYGTRLYWLEPKAVKFSRKPQPTYALPNQALDLCQSDLAAAVGSYIRFEGQRRCTEGKDFKKNHSKILDVAKDDDYMS